MAPPESGTAGTGFSGWSFPSDFTNEMEEVFQPIGVSNHFISEIVDGKRQPENLSRQFQVPAAPFRFRTWVSMRGRAAGF